MKIYTSMAGFVRVEITAADLNGMLEAVSRAGIAAHAVISLDELSAQLSVSRWDYRRLRTLCAKRGDALRLIRREGVYWAGKRLIRRPILLAGVLLLLMSALWMPGKVFFVRVEGNSRISARQILDEAQKCGIGFGSDRREVRSEKVKNALLEAIPGLQWAGVNTEGCVAVIQVRERAQEPREGEISPFGHIVASRDGVITDCTATRGSPRCTPGQAVTEGEILISGYTDCGLTIRAEQAEGEVYALTRREIDAVMVMERQLRTKKQETGKKISLLIGKKRINLWKDSGIWDSTCDRMYEEYYITLPGGFQLPLAISIERYTQWETAIETIPEADARQNLTGFGASYLQQQMLAGKILNGEQTFLSGDGRMQMAGQYICVEMIGKMQRLQIGEHNGENN